MTPTEKQIEIWFFRDLVDEQRLKLFSLMGMPANELTTHGAQKQALRHAISAALAVEAGTDEGGHIWHEKVFSSMKLKCCMNCGFVFNEDRPNKPCPGPIGVEPRSLITSPASSARPLTCQCANSITDPCIVCGKGKTLVTAGWLQKMAAREDDMDCTTGTPHFEPILNGPELWEIVYGVIEGDVPDELTDNVFQRIADAINEAFPRAEYLLDPANIYADRPDPLPAAARQNYERVIAKLQARLDASKAATPASSAVEGEAVADYPYMTENVATPSAFIGSPAPTPAGEWRPIETAPHGVDVLLATPPFEYMGEQAKWELRVGAASWGERIGGISNISRDAHATHWQPLPASPAPQTEGSE